MSSQSNMIITPKKFDVSEISLADVQKNKMGGNMVYMKYGEMKKLTIQTPLMSAPFGISTYIDDKTNVKKYSIDISFKGMEDDPKIKMFHDKMNSFDEFLIEEGARHSKSWFGKAQKKEVVEALYRSLVKPSKEPEKYAPTMKIKIPTRDDEFQVESFKYTAGKSVHEPFDLVNITKGAKVQLILEASSIWFVGKTQFGISWKVLQARVQQPEKIQGYSFRDDSDDDDADPDDPVSDDDADLDITEDMGSATLED